MLASVLTALGLYCGVASMFAAIAERYEQAAYLILAAIVFDMLDGTVAKLTNSVSEFGKQLDSLADLVSFGVAPAILIYMAYLHEERIAGSAVGRTGAMFAIVFVMCGWLRLARFNVYQSKMRDSFVGLPIPAAGGTVATFVLFTRHFSMTVAFWILGPLTLALAYLMVSNVRYPKDRLKSVVMAPRNAFRMLALFAVAIGIIHYGFTHSPAIVLFPLAAAYVLFGIAEDMVKRLHKKTAPDTPQPEEDGEPESLPRKTGESL